VARSPLYRDALTSVLSFFTLSELAITLVVNKEWSAAVQFMRSAKLTADISSAQLAALLSSSHLKRHVGQLGMPLPTTGRCKQRRAHRDILILSSDQLSPVTRALPQLHSLCTELRLLPADSASSEMQFPSRLRRLDLVLLHSGDDHQSARIAVLLGAINQLQQLQTLRLMLRMPLRLAELHRSCHCSSCTH
jgi:hypothetical protein